MIAPDRSIAGSHADSTVAPASKALLAISAQPTAVDNRGDTVRVTLGARNREESTSDLWIFTVEAPAPVLTIEYLGPAGKGEVSMAKKYGISVATWAFNGEQIAPGRSTLPLAFSAVGLPGIVRYWAERFVAPDTIETADDPPDSSQAPVKPGPWNAAEDSGVTVGVVPFPADRSRRALLTRMRTLLQESCAHGWIDDADVCRSLDQKLEQDDTSGLLAELDAQRGKHVNATAYFLLSGNVRALP